jgi:hypothetical protein
MKSNPAPYALFLIIIIVAGILLTNFVLLNYFGDEPPLKVAMLDTGVHEFHIGRNEIEVKDYSFATRKYGYDVDFAANRVGTVHGDEVFYSFLTQLKSKEKVTFYNIRVAGDDLESYISVDAIAAAIRFVTEKLSVQIVILSLGSEIVTEDQDRFLFSPLIDDDILVITSAGNEGIGDNYPGVISSPAVYPDMIAVGAFLDTQIEEYSARGPTSLRTMKPDIVATHENADTIKGTSFTAPTVAAIACDLMNSYHSSYDIFPSAGLVKIALMEGAIPFNGSPLQSQGTGRSDYINSLDLITAYTNIEDLFDVYPDKLPITPDYVWDGIRYTFYVTLTHALEITTIDTLDIVYTGTGEVNFEHEYYSPYTSLLEVVIIPHGNTSGKLSITKGSYLQTIDIDVLPSNVSEMIYYNSQLTDLALSKNRYGSFNNLFSHLAEQGIALIDDPFYSDIDDSLIIDPWSLLDPVQANPLSGDLSQKNIVSLYSIFNEFALEDFFVRGWDVSASLLDENYTTIDVSFSGEVYSISYNGYHLTRRAGTIQDGEPIVIDSGKYKGKVVGLIDDSWLAFLSSETFSNDAFFGLLGPHDHAFIDAIIQWVIA